MSARHLLFALLLGGAVPALAQAPAAPAPDPARLAAATRLVDAVMPPAKRTDMMRAMIEPTLANVRKGFEGSPQFAKTISDDPRAARLLQAFIDRLMRTSMGGAIQAMPALVDAMAAAYARRFTVAQLDEVSAFYRSPTGAAFVREMPGLMADPDVQRVQRDMMAASLSRVNGDAQQLAADLGKLDQTSPKQGSRQ